MGGPLAGLGLLAVVAAALLVLVALRRRGAAAPAPAPAPAPGVDDSSDAWEDPERNLVAAILAGSRGRYGRPRFAGQGGTGVVFKVEDRDRAAIVAIKILDGVARAEAETCTRFLRGARALMELEHPAFPRVHAVSDQPAPYMIIDFIEGRSLYAIFDAEGPQPPERVRGWLKGAAAALAHAHGKGVFHRDVKPENIMEGPEGRLHLIDFDLALTDAQTRITRAGKGQGTLQYTAPEQIQGVKPGAAGDVFSLAASGYFLLSGRHPYPLPVLFAGQGPEPQPLPGVPADLGAALGRALALDPEVRTRGMVEFRTQLGE